MRRIDYIHLLIGGILVSVVLSLTFYYLLSLPSSEDVLLGFVVGFITCVGHELLHIFVAQDICKFKDVEFELPPFLVLLSFYSILLLFVLIYVKNHYHVVSTFLPILASPGAVYIARFKSSRCADEVALAGPLYNFFVGVVTLCLLFLTTTPPFYLNSSNLYISLLSTTSYFSFAMAFFNLLPIKIGCIEFDGYHVLTLDKYDKLTKLAMFIVVVASFYIIYLTGWWRVVIHE